MNPDDARYELRQQRQELSEDARALRHEVSARVDTVKTRLDPVQYVRAYPLLAIGVALGAGLAIALTEADRKAVEAGVSGVKAAGDSLGSGAAAAKEKMSSLMHRSDDPTGDLHPGNEEYLPPTSRSRIHQAIESLLSEGLEDLMHSMGSPRTIDL